VLRRKQKGFLSSALLIAKPLAPSATQPNKNITIDKEKYKAKQYFIKI
jgi:hypothetical protein